MIDKDRRQEQTFKDFTKKAKKNQVFKKLIQETDEHDNTLLHYAAKAGNLKACKILKKQEVDMKAKNKNEMTPLEFAARCGDGQPEEVFKCIEWIMIEENKEDMTPILHHAIQNGNWSANTHVAEELIKTGKCKISKPDKKYQNTCLHLAAMYDIDKEHTILDLFLEDENITEVDLLECLQKRNHKGRTPFHIACYVGNHVSVKQLIKKGKDLEVDVSAILNSRDHSGRLPIYTAIDSNNIELLKVLMPEVEMTDNDINRGKG